MGSTQTLIARRAAKEVLGADDAFAFINESLTRSLNATAVATTSVIAGI